MVEGRTCNRQIVPAYRFGLTADKNTGNLESRSGDINLSIGLFSGRKCRVLGQLDSVVVVLQFGDATLISNRALEHGSTIVDVVLHGNAAGGGYDVAVLGPGMGVVVDSGCPLRVILPVGYTLRIVSLYVRVFCNADRAVAEVEELGRIVHIVNGCAAGREKRSGRAVLPGNGTGSSYLAVGVS